MLTPGSYFAGYQVERILGRGGMGDVYLARHPRLPRSDALKLMSEELSRSEVYRQRFSAEADIASQVQHDSVVRVYDRGEDDGRLWLAMEYIQGRDLSAILAVDGRLDLERSVALIERIAAGLDAIHANGLLHRDVKPANILVTRDVLGAERALLTDFGIARSAADSLGLTGVGDIVATLHYAAPEQFELRSGELDRRVDVYALGCVLYEILTGRVPLQGSSVAEFWQVMQSQVPPPPSREVPGVPLALDAVIAKVLSKRREDRYGSAGEFARAARQALTEVRTIVSPPVPVETPEATRAYVPHAGPFRIGLRRQDPNAPGGSRQFGPISSDQLAPTEASRLQWLINASNVLTLPSTLAGGWGPDSALTIEVPGRFHTVSWAGQTPPVLTDLVGDVERLAGSSGAPQPVQAPPVQPPVAAPPVPTAQQYGSSPVGAGAPAKSGSRKWLLVGLIALVVVALAVAIPLILTSSKKPVPGVPLAVHAEAGRGTVTLTWQPGTGTTDHYKIFRDSRVIAPSATGTTYIDRLSDTKTHGYAIQAVNAAGRTSALSPTVVIAARVRPLDNAERLLMNRLPTTLVDEQSCVPILTGVNRDLETAISCGPEAGQSPSPPGVVPTAVEAYSANSITQLNLALDAEIRTHKAVSGSCSGIPQEGTWNFTETPKVLNGKIICYAIGSKAYLLWSYTTQKMYIRISTSSPYADLLKYWQDAALHLP